MSLRSLAVVALAGTLAAPAEHVVPLLHADLRDVPSHAVTAVLVEYPPGGISRAHHHGGSVFAYVVAGAVRSRVVPGGPTRTYHAGESFFEPAGSVHLVSANASRTAPARLLAVFVAPRASRLTIPEASAR